MVLLLGGAILSGWTTWRQYEIEKLRATSPLVVRPAQSSSVVDPKVLREAAKEGAREGATQERPDAAKIGFYLAFAYEWDNYRGAKLGDEFDARQIDFSNPPRRRFRPGEEARVQIGIVNDNARIPLLDSSAALGVLGFGFSW